jgi:predicted nucleotidyltransferase
VNPNDTLTIAEDLAVSQKDLDLLARQFHIRKLALFGSAARRELRPDSDIDLLVEFELGHAPSLAGMVKLKDALSALFANRAVDLATPSILENPYRRRAIEKDMEELYAA